MTGKSVFIRRPPAIHKITQRTLFEFDITDTLLTWRAKFAKLEYSHQTAIHPYHTRIFNSLAQNFDYWTAEAQNLMCIPNNFKEQVAQVLIVWLNIQIDV